MFRTTRLTAAFTLAELMVSMVVLGIALTIGISGWAHILVGEKRVEAQCSLDMDVRSSVERLRADMRVSDMNSILFYPIGVGPYSAVSFPVTVPVSSTNLLDGGGTNIVWDRTVIYHIYPSAPNQLKRTVFFNRDPNASVSNRQVQLNRVVADGHGANACINGETTSSSVLFQNLFDWSLTPQTARFDCYASTTMRDRFFFGSTLIGSGAHTVDFKVIGKNPQGNANLYLGVDSLNCSVSGSDQEAEDHAVTTFGGDPVVAKTYIPNGSWSGNYHLLAICATNNQGFSVTVQNDCWEEVNFQIPGALAENTTRDFDTSLSPWYHHVIRMVGATGDLWQAGGWGAVPVAQSQCNDTVPDNLQAPPLNVCMRILIRGEYIRKNGFGPILLFAKSSPNPILTCPTFAVASVESYASSCDAMTGTVQALQFYQDGAFTSWADCHNGTVYAVPQTPVDICANQSYLVSFYTQNASGSRDLYHNEDYRNPNIGSYILTNVSPDATYAETWSTNACITTDRYLVSSPGKLYALYQMASGFASNGVYTSIIFDSGQTAPVAKSISWSNSIPANTWLQLTARTGNNPDLSDAPAWTNLNPLTSFGAFPYNTGRYIQFRATMRINSLLYPCPTTPQLHSVSFTWPGETKMVDVAGILTRGTDYAQCEVTVDGKPLTRAIKLDLSIYKDVRRISGGTERFTSFITAEISPRNTGL